MLTFLFFIMMFAVFGKLLIFAFKATWGLSKIFLFLVFSPIILVVLFFIGLVKIALPVLVVIGIISLLRPKYGRT